MSRSSRYLALLLATAFLGAGCLKSSTPPPPKAAQSNPNAAVVQPPSSVTANDQPALTPAQELNAALQNFRDLNTFRAKLDMSGAKPPLTGTIEVSKPGRMSANMQIGTDQLGIVIAGTNAYLQTDGGKWADISNTAQGQKMTLLLSSLTFGQSSVENFGVGPTDTVTKTHDDAKKCDLFSATLKGANGEIDPVRACVNPDGTLQYVSIDTKTNGTITFSYYDENVLFLIERPI